MLAEKLLMRRQFIPDPQGTSLMFAFFAQHFTHQFFKTDTKRGPAFTLAKGHGVSRVEPYQILLKCFSLKKSIHLRHYFSLQVDLSHIYGDNLDRQHKLRLFKDGKLRYQVGRKKMDSGAVVDKAA